LFLPLSHTHCAAHSFPTRRSSDLYLGLINDVKEGIVILGRLSASIRSDCFAETLRFKAHVYADASDHAAENYAAFLALWRRYETDRKSTRLNSSHVKISYAVFCLK